MGTRRVARAGVLLVAFAVALTCLGGAAQAKHKKRKRDPIKTFTAQAIASGANGSTATATATCGRGRRATGGGFSETTPTTGSHGIVYESHKVGQNAWTASTQVRTTAPAQPPVSLTAYVYCNKRFPVTTQVTATIPTAANQAYQFVTANCRGRATPFTDGFATPPPVNGSGIANVIVSKHEGQVEAYGGGSASTATAYADCAKTRRIKFDGTNSDVSAPNSTVGTNSSSTSQCDAFKRSIGGLFGGWTSQGHSLFGGGSLFAVYESLATGSGLNALIRSWKVSGFHLGGFNPGPLKIASTAYCPVIKAKKAKKKKKK